MKYKGHIKQMTYYEKLRLNERQYLAITSGGLIIVTEDENGKPIRWAMFGNGINQKTFNDVKKIDGGAKWNNIGW